MKTRPRTRKRRREQLVTGASRTSARALVPLLLGAALVAGCSGNGTGGTGPQTGTSHSVATVELTPTADTLLVRHTVQLTAVARDGSGDVVSDSTTWSSSDTTVAIVSGSGSVAALSAGQATITAAVDGRSATATVVVDPAHLTVRGLFTQFEERGAPNGYYDGDVLQRWDSTDAYVGTTVSAEIASQMDAIRALGVNTITFELRATDDHYDPSGFQPPDCNIPPVLGVLWPTPETAKLRNLVRLFDLAQQKGLLIILSLVDTHMEQPADSNAAWIGPILGAVGQHPALSLVLFAGDVHVDPVTGKCGIPAEAPLWLGASSTPAKYVEWAIGYAKGLGVSPAKLSSEAIVGDAFVDSRPPAGANATDGHLWDPLGVLKGIFDDLQIPDAQRTYALSFYEHPKCAAPAPNGCVEIGEAAWAEQTIRGIYRTIGRTSKAAVVAGEMGTDTGDPSWSTAQGLDNLLTLMEKYGVDGGSFWRWTDFSNDEESDPSVATPVKRRGYAYLYTPVKDVLVKHYLR